MGVSGFCTDIYSAIRLGNISRRRTFAACSSLILRRREAPSRRMAARPESLAMLRDALLRNAPQHEADQFRVTPAAQPRNEAHKNRSVVRTPIPLRPAWSQPHLSI